MLALAATVRLISAVAVAIRRSRCRVSVTSSAARRRSVRGPVARGRTPRSSRAAGVGVELTGCAAGDQLGEQGVEPVDRLGAGPHDVVAVLDQGAQRGDRFVDGDTAQTYRGQRGDTDRDRVVAVALAAMPGGEHPHPRGQLRGYIHRVDAVRGQPGGQRRAQPGGALDRPHHLRPAGREATQLPVAAPADRHPQGVQRRHTRTDRRRRPRRLVRVDRDHH
ncbi:hypothetical protein LQ327_33195 [Actinomycetospora endophytica]|uniref:Uncharacterized protein n=1 Tax=Actinomycetospora endophytica TaxID=2291215 RepID=A0ABS8PJY2_9PSEU|nr:hypothetical protein [Actinomycetospora endophytica]MCD2198232.1 hypothetical protein [Actinomycetospora endophytica]